MTDIVPVFGYSHPFWQEAIDLRRQNYSYVQIAEAAKTKGFELTYKQISGGLAKAPLNLNLPATTSKRLRKKYEALEADFNAFTTMRDLTQEALAKAAEAEEELEADDLTTAKRMKLEQDRDSWLSKAFSWAKDCAALEVSIGTLLSERGKQQESNSGGVIDGEILNEILNDFNSKLPPLSEEHMIRQYGGDNVRMGSDGLDSYDPDAEE